MYFIGLLLPGVHVCVSVDVCMYLLMFVGGGGGGVECVHVPNV